MLFRLSVTPEPLLFIFCNSMLPEVSPLHSLDLLHVPGNVGRHQVYPTTRRNSFNSCEAVGDDASAPRRWYAAQRWAASGATVGMRVEPGHRSAGRPPKASWRRPGTHTREARGTPRTTARMHPHRPCRAGRSDSIHPLWRSPVGPPTGSRPRMRSGRVPRARPRARGSRGPRCPNDRRRASTRRARTRRWRRSTSRCATTSDVSSSVLGLRPSETRGSVARGSVNRRDTSCWRAAGWRARRKREDAPRFRSRASELPWFLRGRDYPWTRLRFRFGCTRRRNIGAGGVHQWIDNSVEETQSKVVATRVFRVLVAAGCSFLWVAACRSGPDENMRSADIRYERVMPPPEPQPEPPAMAPRKVVSSSFAPLGGQDGGNNGARVPGTFPPRRCAANHARANVEKPRRKASRRSRGRERAAKSAARESPAGIPASRVTVPVTRAWVAHADVQLGEGSEHGS